MNQALSLSEVFDKRLFRIPDYQRGYSWREKQLEQFWDDLVSMGDRRHYAGVLTVRAVSVDSPKSQEHWLCHDHSYRCYHVVDGQQRLTSIVLLVAAIVHHFRPYADGSDPQVVGTLMTSNLEDTFLYRIHPEGDMETNIVNYAVDGSLCQVLHSCLRSTRIDASIRNEASNLYTRNLVFAREFFISRLKDLVQQQGPDAIGLFYHRLTQNLFFNMYEIEDEFDVHISFETMNNRGLSLSTLDLVKNRLMYLTNLFHPGKEQTAARHTLLTHVKDNWQKIYDELGHHPTQQLNEDSFLRDHWIAYFGKSGSENECARFLLEERFTKAAVHGSSPSISPGDIHDYVVDLGTSVRHWVSTHFPEKVHNTPLRAELERLQRMGVGSLRPLVMEILGHRDDLLAGEAIRTVERFRFLAFAMAGRRSDYGKAEFHRLAHAIHSDQKELRDAIDQIQAWTTESAESVDLLANRFAGILTKNSGQLDYYQWSGLKHLLYEYERFLAREDGPEKVTWQKIVTNSETTISIEHIAPQTPTPYWEQKIPDEYEAWAQQLGNLVLLAKPINSALQNRPFEEKKNATWDKSGKVARVGYSTGSYSELEVARETEWNADSIRRRGLRILEFMAEHWSIPFSDAHKQQLVSPTPKRQVPISDPLDFE